jgi:hypothetical protein
VATLCAIADDPSMLVRGSRPLRLIGPALIGLGLVAFVHVVGRMAPDRITATAVVVLVAQVYVISELCHWLPRALDRSGRFELGSGRRVLVEVALASIASCVYALGVYTPIKMWLIAQGEQDSIGAMHVALVGLAALGVSLLLSCMRLALELLTGWQGATLVAAARQREVLRAQLDALQAQVNPHFLFNALNTIYGVIPEDPDRAQELLLKLASVFRYALRHGTTSLVPLSAELGFAAAFADLLLVRHGAGLVIERRLAGAEGEVLIPPMTLQLLIENAVKHNRVDPNDPLRIVIEHDGRRLRVSNQSRPRRTPSPGEGKGLRNIVERFQLVGAMDVTIRSAPDRFEVDMPLLRQP